MRILDFTSWFLFLVVVLLYVAAVYVAVGRRRVALRSVGLSLIVAGLLVLMLRSVGVRTAVDAVVKDPTKDDLANAVAAIATELLDQLAWTGVIYGLLIVAFAVLLGDHRWAVSIRRSIAGFADSTAMIVAIATVVVLILFWWSPGDAFDRWVTGLTLVGLAIGAVVALVVTGRRELPVDSSSAPQAVIQAETSE